MILKIIILYQIKKKDINPILGGAVTVKEKEDINLILGSALTRVDTHAFWRRRYL